VARKKRSSPDSLPEAELEILSVLQELRQAEAAELRRRLQAQRPLSHASVVTLLGRLRERGLVDRRKALEGKAFLYYPTAAAAKTSERVLGRLLTRVFHDNTVSMVSSLFGAKAPTQAQVDELRSMLDEIESRDVDGKSKR